MYLLLDQVSSGCLVLIPWCSCCCFCDVFLVFGPVECRMRSTTVGTFERWGGEEWGGECTALEVLTVGSDGSHRHRFGKSIFKLYSFVASAQVE